MSYLYGMITPLKLEDKASAKQLLQENELPFEDIDEHLDHFLKFEQESHLAGIIGMENCGNSGLLRSLVVSEAFRDQGIASQLVSSLEKYAIDGGFKSLFLLTTTAESYFGRKGYQQIKREEVPNEIQSTKEFSTLCPSSAVCMKKVL